MRCYNIIANSMVHQERFPGFINHMAARLPFACTAVVLKKVTATRDSTARERETQNPCSTTAQSRTAIRTLVCSSLFTCYYHIIVPGTCYEVLVHRKKISEIFVFQTHNGNNLP